MLDEQCVKSLIRWIEKQVGFIKLLRHKFNIYSININNTLLKTILFPGIIYFLLIAFEIYLQVSKLNMFKTLLSFDEKFLSNFKIKRFLIEYVTMKHLKQAFSKMIEKHFG